MNDAIKDLTHALSLMETALSLIDRSERASDAGAHLDLAVVRLRQFIARTSLGGRLDSSQVA